MDQSTSGSSGFDLELEERLWRVTILSDMMKTTAGMGRRCLEGINEERRDLQLSLLVRQREPVGGKVSWEFDRRSYHQTYFINYFQISADDSALLP